MSKPSLPQGTRDFGPDVVRKRNYILNTIRNVFELYGFQPLETPAMENLETLMGKYGEDGDKLIFKILNNGLDNPGKEKKAREDFEKVLQGKNVPGITERALKYDLTIPFARYVAMNQGQLVFPFKRYQIQPVWRADRPQKGRYREFYQCDADVVGSNSLLNEVELACMYATVFTQLRISDFRLQVNNRKVLKGIMEVCDVSMKEKQILVIIDKTDKIGINGVKEELSKEDIGAEKLEKLLEVYLYKGNNDETISFLKKFLANSAIGLEGVNDLEFILRYIQQSASRWLSGLQSKISIDLTLARGLEYYTGIIFEVKAPEQVKIGSIGGGGRYDDLTGLFGVPDIPGVGISFGVDRIYDVIEELNLFPATVHTGTQVLFFNLGEAESKIAFGLMQQLRENGIRSELYHEQVKFDKQFKYAEKKNIPFVIIIGEKEMNDKTCTIKNLGNGEQQTIPVTELINFVFQPALL
jgi:histidyl-tRNA synthetase